MYSTKTNVQQLVALLMQYDIQDVVVCPGSRNAPIVQTLSAVESMICHSVADERSAGFYAIGIHNATGDIVAVCCTSGTALLNLAPAVAEAYYQNIPLVIISADRPEMWIGQMDGQTIPQQGVFNGLVKADVQLTECKDNESRWYNNRLINEALTAATLHGLGPVHINVPISEPMFDFSAKKLPEERVINHDAVINILDDRKVPWSNYNKILVVCGQQTTYSSPYDVDILAEKGCVVFKELISNDISKSKTITNFDAVLYTLEQNGCPEELVPDLVISFGGNIVSKRLKKFLREHNVTHWLINDSGKITDTFMNVSNVFEGDTSFIIENFTSLTKKKPDFKKAWKKESDAIGKKSKKYFESIVGDLSSFNMVYQLMSNINNLSSLHLGNSMSVRLAQLFQPDTFIPVCCNRGVNGIEGTLSTAVGYAESSGEMCYVIIGDLSFFYDMNVLRHATGLANMRILLLNNGGGGIFHTMNGLNSASSLDKFVSAEHHTSAEGWAKELGFNYLKVINTSQIKGAIDMLNDVDSIQPVLIEAMTDSTFDKHVFNNYYKFLLQ